MGQGVFRLCIDAKTGKYMVGKLPSKSWIWINWIQLLTNLLSTSFSKLRHETEIMKILKSQSAIKHYDTVFSKSKLYIVTEYIYGEDLFDYVKKWKRLGER